MTDTPSISVSEVGADNVTTAGSPIETVIRIQSKSLIPTAESSQRIKFIILRIDFTSHSAQFVISRRTAHNLWFKPQIVRCAT